MTHSITAIKRAAGAAKNDRSSGQLPCVLYGPEIKPVSISVNAIEFDKLHNIAGGSSLVDIVLDGASVPAKALIQDIQYDPVTGRAVHADFWQVDMKKEMHTSVSLRFISEAPAVKELGGTLIKALASLEVKCLPKDLISHIDIDLSVLKTFDDIIRVRDLNIPAGISALVNPETTVTKVVPPLTEEQLKAMEEEGVKSVQDIEVEEKGKKEEGEEGAEGGAESAPAAQPAEKSEKKEK